MCLSRVAFLPKMEINEAQNVPAKIALRINNTRVTTESISHFSILMI